MLLRAGTRAKKKPVGGVGRCPSEKAYIDGHTGLGSTTAATPRTCLPATDGRFLQTTGPGYRPCDTTTCPALRITHLPFLPVTRNSVAKHQAETGSWTSGPR